MPGNGNGEPPTIACDFANSPTLNARVDAYGSEEETLDSYQTAHPFRIKVITVLRGFGSYEENNNSQAVWRLLPSIPRLLFSYTSSYMLLKSWPAYFSVVYILDYTVTCSALTLIPATAPYYSGLFNSALLVSNGLSQGLWRLWSSW